MQYLADLHIHSPYSRATSKESTLAGLFAWARVKGIHLIGTGDFTHPGWFRHLKEGLAPAEPGLYRLSDERVPAALAGVSPEAIAVRFILTAEISCIYKRHGQVRKVHNILIVPDFAAAERVNARLAALGNIESDGRPILGLDSRNLLEILLEASADGFLVPAHIWTPWFSLFGSKSGFNAIEDCYGDLTRHIFALETGLSSDPAMNRLVSALDRFSLISNSDCHSPSKLGREVNCFATGFDYFSLRRALECPAEGGFLGTVEFFPEEGKYHHDGHRQCQVCLDPLATRAIDAICPVCSRPLTIGVTHRVLELADRTKPVYPANQPGFESLVPLPEILGEIFGQGPATKRVASFYGSLINQFGSEFTLLRHTPLEEIRRLSPVLGEAIARVRTGQVIRQAGYDGEFGRILVFHEGERAELAGQESLFARPVRKETRPKPAPRAVLPAKPVAAASVAKAPAPALNPEQEAAVRCTADRILVVAGPGTGKTHTLIERIRFLVEEKTPASAIAAITFTNRAAAEMEERLARQGIDGVFVGTFHRLCLDWLRREQPGLVVAGPDDRELVLKRLGASLDSQERRRMSAEISGYFQALNTAKTPPLASAGTQAYLDALAEQAMVDLDGVIPLLLQRLASSLEMRERVRQQVRVLLVDEFQDVNRAQYDLVRAVAAHAGVFAIGDPNQAIYGFRGSNLNFFFDFAESGGLPGQTTVISLTQNYRSAATILTAASAVIAHNRKRYDAELAPQRPGTGIIEYFQAPTPNAEAEFVARRIETLVGGMSHRTIHAHRQDSLTKERGFAEVAVLYRLTAQAEALSQALSRRGIPAQVVGVTPFFMNEGLASLYYWLQAAAGTATVAEQVLLCQGVGLSKKTIETLEQLSAAVPSFFAAARQLGLPANQAEQITQLEQGLGAFAEEARSRSVSAALAGTLPRLGLAPTEGSRRLAELAGIFGRDLSAFANHLRANVRGTVYDAQAEAVSLMSLHAAKGLEFAVVFICGLEEGVLPYQQPGRESDVEEERRLCYVGMTRAREQLILTSALTRSRHGQAMATTPSRFVQEIPPGVLTAIQPGRQKGRGEGRQLSLFG